MLKKLVHHAVGCISVICYFINTVFWCIPIILMSFLKVIPIKHWRTFISYLLDGCATAWISVNNLNQRVSGRTKWDIKGLDYLTKNNCYLVISNHQSWVDILVLQRIFNRKIPFLKFFLKHELIWVPFLGLAWWALDFPFMRRFSKDYLAKNPHMKGKDFETTKKACEKFQYKPVSVMNFVEGTRWTKQKHAKQNSNFNHVLKPKAGGLAYVLGAMGTHLNTLLNVTIHYPDGIPSYWDFVCGKVKRIQVNVTSMNISDIMNEDVFTERYFSEPAQRAQFQQWLNAVWVEKDQELLNLSAGN